MTHELPLRRTRIYFWQVRVKTPIEFRNEVGAMQPPNQAHTKTSALNGPAYQMIVFCRTKRLEAFMFWKVSGPYFVNFPPLRISQINLDRDLN